MIPRFSYGKKTLFLFLFFVFVFYLPGCDSINNDNYMLFVEVEGEGLAQISPERTRYNEGTEVELKAVTATDGQWYFSHWSGDVVANEEEISFVIEKDVVVVAHFKLKDGAALEGNLRIQHTWPNSPNFSANQNNSFPSGEITGFEREFESGELIIQMMPFSSTEDRANVARALGGKIKGEIRELEIILLKVPGDTFEKLAVVNNLPEVINAQPNYIYQSQNSIPNDPKFSYQWHYPLIRLPQAWEKTTGSGNINIAVLDTGVDGKHPDLDGVVQGYNFIDGNEDTMDYHGHGTHVAGTIMASTNNDEGVSGAMWQGQIVPVKVLGDNGGGSTWSVAQGILYASGLLEDVPNPNPAQVINMSLGGRERDDALENAVRKARENGTILVAAAGNNNEEKLSYPAAFKDVISVGSVAYTSSGAPTRAKYSNYGNDLDIVAPGGGSGKGVLSTYFSGSGDSKTYEYAYMVGTSMATPHVSGVIGLMLASGMPEGEIRETLHKTAMDLGKEGFDPEFGYGLINANWAVNEVDSVKIIVGERDGNTINARAEKTIPLGEKYFEFPEIVPGEYRVYAWIDIEGNGIIEPGDYIAESDWVNFEPGKKVSVELILKEY